MNASCIIGAIRYGAWNRALAHGGRNQPDAIANLVLFGDPPQVSVCGTIPQLQALFSCPLGNGRRRPSRTTASRIMGLMGFSVMRSPDRGHSKDGRRIASQPPLDRAGRCTDAVAPGSRDAETTLQG